MRQFKAKLHNSALKLYYTYGEFCFGLTPRVQCHAKTHLRRPQRKMDKVNNFGN